MMSLTEKKIRITEDQRSSEWINCRNQKSIDDQKLVTKFKTHQ